jgi:hypothetical protein
MDELVFPQDVGVQVGDQVIVRRRGGLTVRQLYKAAVLSSIDLMELSDESVVGACAKIADAMIAEDEMHEKGQA